MQKRKRRAPVTRPKRSPIWLQMSDTDFAQLVAHSAHIGNVLNAFGLENVGRNHHTAKARIAQLNLDTTHFNPKARQYGNAAKPLEEVMVEESAYSRGALKRRLLNATTPLLPNHCALCQQPPYWNNAPMILILDHINGKRNDHRHSNLRLLCPNCNSQQATFAGRNTKTTHD